MTDLTPERRAELRQLLDDHMTDAGEWCCDVLPQAAMDALLVLLDAADERDRLLTVVHEADQLHAAALAAEGELLGDSPELPRWERLLLNGLTLPELAKNVADERDQLAAAVERVRALGKRYEADALSEGYGGELWSATAAAIHRALDGTEDPAT